MKPSHLCSHSYLVPPSLYFFILTSFSSAVSLYSPHSLPFFLFLKKTVIGVTRFSPSSEAPVVFPESLADLENTTYAGSITAQITIPASLLAERQEGEGSYYKKPTYGLHYRAHQPCIVVK